MRNHWQPPSTQTYIDEDVGGPGTTPLLFTPLPATGQFQLLDPSKARNVWKWCRHEEADTKGTDSGF